LTRFRYKARKSEPGHTLDAEVYLYKEGDILVGELTFWKSGPSKGCNTMNGSIPSLCYHTSKFNDIMNILRYEKPLYIYDNEEDNAGGIWSYFPWEPVGPPFRPP
jgi:hypothetical protein